MEKIKQDSIKHQDLITYEGIYRLNVTTKAPMFKRIKFAILINELRQELQLDKIEFKEEIQFLKDRIKVLTD